MAHLTTFLSSARAHSSVTGPSVESCNVFVMATECEGAVEGFRDTDGKQSLKMSWM